MESALKCSVERASTRILDQRSLIQLARPSEHRFIPRGSAHVRAGIGADEFESLVGGHVERNQLSTARTSIRARRVPLGKPPLNLLAGKLSRQRFVSVVATAGRKATDVLVAAEGPATVNVAGLGTVQTRQRLYKAFVALQRANGVERAMGFSFNVEAVRELMGHRDLETTSIADERKAAISTFDGQPSALNVNQAFSACLVVL